MKDIINSMVVYETGDRKNRSILFVHGFPYDHRMWENQINALKKDYHCVAYDIRGLGESYVGDGQFTLEAFADDLFSIVHLKKLNNPILCGLSMGGYISLRAVERDQSRFGGLILCDTKSEADNDEGKIKRAAAINQINVEGVTAFVNNFVPNCFADETSKNMKEMYESVLYRARRSNPIGLKGALLAMVSRTDTTPFLPSISIPTLLMVGAQDNLTPPPVMRDVSKGIKNSEFGIVPRAGHMAPLENPGFVNDMMKGFLKRI